MARVFITGASSDIGMAVCHLYLSRGYTVVGHYHRGHGAFFDLVEKTDKMTALQIDLSESSNLERALTDQPAMFAATDVLINGAAVLDPAPFAGISAERVLRAMTVNVVPALVLMQTIAPAMIERGWGRIVHLSSIGVKFGGGSASFCYALSKHALEYMPSDYKAWAAHNVFVNALRIGVTDTRFHRQDPNKDMAARIALIPAQRMATPEEIANAIYGYGSDENSFTTGQVITIAGGE